MKFIVLAIFLANFYFAENFLIPDGNQWNDLKVTWGANPLDYNKNTFVSLPRTEENAKKAGWTLVKGCSNGANGNRYVLNNDLSTILIFNANGLIAGFVFNFNCV